MAAADIASLATVRATKRWVPRRVLITPSAAKLEYGRAIASRAAALGSDVVELRADRVTGLRSDDPREEYARAKSTLAVVVAPGSKRTLQPIPPSADWRVDLAEGCPAPLPILLPGRLARRTADHPRVRRIGALRRCAQAAYPIGLTIAPIFPLDDWRAAYDDLLSAVADATADIAGLDLTVECITHRFTDVSRDVLRAWYPHSELEMDPERRTAKRTKFGAIKRVFPKETMRELRDFFEAAIARRLPRANIVYWT